jgi:hypothetical protein
MTWEECLARVAQTLGCAEICGRVEDVPSGWVHQLRTVWREARRDLEAEPEIEAGL